MGFGSARTLAMRGISAYATNFPEGLLIGLVFQGRWRRCAKLSEDIITNGFTFGQFPPSATFKRLIGSGCQ
jgi:hypothetical protein